MFGPVCTIEASFFKTMSGMDRHPFEGRHLVGILFKIFAELLMCPPEGLLGTHIFCPQTALSRRKKEDSYSP